MINPPKKHRTLIFHFLIFSLILSSSGLGHHFPDLHLDDAVNGEMIVFSSDKSEPAAAGSVDADGSTDRQTDSLNAHPIGRITDLLH